MTRAIPRALFASLLAAAVALACTTPGILNPAVGPGTEYPCGIGGTVCSGSTVAVPLCCPQNTICCDGTTCPPGECAYVGESFMARRRDAGR